MSGAVRAHPPPVMKKSLPLLLALLGVGAFLPCSSAEDILAGQKLPALDTKTGQHYDNVTVREVTPDGIKIMFDGGVKTIPARELPQYAEAFDRLKAEVPVAPAAPVTPAPSADPSAPAAATDEAAWLPQNNADVVACSLFVDVSKGIGHGGGEGSWKGSAFLCNLGKTTYIYSNAHNFDGAVDFQIHDTKGTVYSDFASVEIAGPNQAFWKASGYGGDIVRIRLKNFYPQALTLDSRPLTADNAKGRKILITGNTGGLGKITELEGLVTSLAPDYIIIHNAAVEGGNSGSPIVDLSTHKVIGILTWGLKLDATLEEIWSKQPVAQRQGINVGAGLATITYVSTSFEQLRQQRVAMNELKKRIRLLGLLDTLIPAKQGVFVNTQTIVMGDYTVADLLAESANHPVVRELLRLDKVLRAKGGAIAISNAEMLKLYENSLRVCLSSISSERIAMETTQSATFFMKCNLKRSRVIDICKAYENLCARSVDWFVQQQGSGGKALAIDSHVRLPPLRSGLKGLGLKE
ncbi:MAG: Trypsin-like peptidase protein [Akkermansiaceae bacterium]|nr:Trypsin-like peptidase protein [Akkermansiaceae bacterium]